MKKVTKKITKKLPVSKKINFSKKLTYSNVKPVIKGQYPNGHKTIGSRLT